MNRSSIVGVTCALTLTCASCASPESEAAHEVQQATTSAAGSSATIALPRAVGARHLLVALVTWNGRDPLAVSGGARSWAATGPSKPHGSDTSSPDTRSQLVYGIADGRVPVTVSAAGSTRVRVDLREYSGVDASAPLVAGDASGSPARTDGGERGLELTALTTADSPSELRDRTVDLSSRVESDEPVGGTPSDITATFKVGSPSQPTRDPLRQPFASSSIWNTAIGSSARFAPAGLPAIPGGDRFAPMPQNDATSILQTPTAPLIDLRYSSAGWTGRSRCTATGSTVLARVPVPASYVVTSSLDNEGASFLMPDRRTIDQSAPLARCVRGGYATSIDTGDPVDLYGSGLSGGLGGSGLAGIGGVLRRGEMRPDTNGTGVRHALRVNLDTTRQLARCDTASSCFRWPASSADSDAVSAYGRLGPGGPSAMRLGALLAIPSSVNIGSLGLQTAPGRQLAWTLQNYGAYVTDSAACACFAIVTEKGPDGDFAGQFKGDYGVDFAQRVNDGSPWTRDLQKLQTVLSVVDNNGPGAVGGGGLPRQPAAPAISP